MSQSTVCDRCGRPLHHQADALAGASEQAAPEQVSWVAVDAGSVDAGTASADVGIDLLCACGHVTALRPAAWFASPERAALRRARSAPACGGADGESGKTVPPA